jgi:hypothetical protein
MRPLRERSDMAPYDFEFAPAKVPDKALDWRTYTEPPYALDEANARAIAERVGQDKVFLSGSFQVNVRACKPRENWPAMFHASIKRRDREAMLDRSAFQEIKNAVFGERCEGMELYPSTTRVLDVANQYHLWVPAEEGGWLEVGRPVADPVEIAMGDWVVRMQGLEEVRGSGYPVAFRLDGWHRDSRKERATDWRLLQQMKGMVCGEGAEGVMVFPSSNRKQKGRMERAIWVLKSGLRFPFGFETGSVGSEEDARRLGAKQRPNEAFVVAHAES